MRARTKAGPAEAYALKHPLPREVRDTIGEALARNRHDFGISTTKGEVEQVLALLALRGFVVVSIDQLEEGTS